MAPKISGVSATACLARGGSRRAARGRLGSPQTRRGSGRLWVRPGLGSKHQEKEVASQKAVSGGPQRKSHFRSSGLAKESVNLLFTTKMVQTRKVTKVRSTQGVSMVSNNQSAYPTNRYSFHTNRKMSTSKIGGTSQLRVHVLGNC